MTDSGTANPEDPDHLNGDPPGIGAPLTDLSDLSDHEMHVLTCPACRVIDRADGVEDGQLWRPNHFNTSAERKLVAMLQRVQGQAADGITNFAGSMRFIYLHIGWFGIWIALNVGLIGMGNRFDKF
ncbi:MAG: hypothetical protein JWL72_1247, partial [Ilumatobacteraceae bacterium]|nr:hypothetical protein [Ilumatobacteraceae bacterium]